MSNRYLKDAFKQFLREQNEIELMRNDVLKKDFATITEIVKAKLLYKTKSRDGIKNLCRRGVIKKDEYKIENNRWYVSTKAILELRNGTRKY